MPGWSVTTTTATLVASTAVSAIELRTGALPIKIVKWWADFNSATSTDKPVLVQAGRFSAAVTTNTAATPAAMSYLGAETGAQTAAGVNATTEGAGTAAAQTEAHNVAPQGGLYAAWETDDTALWVPPNSFWRLRITPGSAITATTANCGVVWVE
ncbi:hypothetical protein P3T37_004059 [Kitasatospora sp. MAA4]|uniref:hypothetical protein n=1 Tax=Kitasatospora sp. MAA4 TaxID=3035093 RepID=UPI002474305C|nr:hypothetical protein [Kitasatospora sp. MAA4]MDH6134655.1 hypothetical protein [Kitasatospora sp. MAA4]